MKTIDLVAHGSKRQGSWSNPKVNIITKAGKHLSPDDAKDYLNGGNTP